MIVIGRGASDSDANADFYKMARLFAETKEAQDFLHCTTGFIGITKPSLKDSLELIARTKPNKVVILPYLLSSGFLIKKIQDIINTFKKEYKWIQFIIASPLGLNEIIASVLNYRIQQTLTGELNLICDNCKYRAPLATISQTNGLKALLWSVRHQFTHQQSMPSEHAHPKLTKHVFVCGNIDCANNGSIGVLNMLRAEIKKHKLTQKILVTRTSCMGRCSDGPTLIVYPDGIWYKKVQTEDVPALVKEHLINDKLVSHLVDNIMD